MRATVMYGAGDVRVDTVPTYIEELLPTFHRDVQRGREHDLRPLGEGRGRYPSHDRLPPDLPKGRPTSALMMIVRFLRRGGGLRRGQHGRSGGQRGCRVGDGDDRATARRLGRPRAARRVAHGARDGARGNGGRLEHPARRRRDLRAAPQLRVARDCRARRGRQTRFMRHHSYPPGRKESHSVGPNWPARAVTIRYLSTYARVRESIQGGQ